VTFATPDGVTISATLRIGERGTTPIILVHQLGSTRAEWEPLVVKLAAQGWTSLAIDLRGHGESTAGTGPSPRTYAYSSFREADWRDTQRDVRAALDFLAGREEIAAQSAVLIGSSIGGTACLAAAADDPRAVRVAVLSPGRAYRGFDAIIPASKLGERELLILRAQDEAMTQETGEVLDRIASHSTLRLVPGASHGVAMFADDPTQLDALVDFVRAAQPQ
jgi:pimeloyl-ACP methyl ester carboxylesterase